MINFINLIETNFINVIRFWSQLGIKEKNLSKYNSIIVDLPQDRISRITLNRPKQRNSLSAELRTELFQVLESNDLNKEISVTIIRGSGESFSAGYDLKRSDDDIDPY